MFRPGFARPLRIAALSGAFAGSVLAPTWLLAIRPNSSAPPRVASPSLLTVLRAAAAPTPQPAGSSASRARDALRRAALPHLPAAAGSLQQALTQGRTAPAVGKPVARRRPDGDFRPGRPAGDTVGRGRDGRAVSPGGRSGGRSEADQEAGSATEEARSPAATADRACTDPDGACSIRTVRSAGPDGRPRAGTLARRAREHGRGPSTEPEGIRPGHPRSRRQEAHPRRAAADRGRPGLTRARRRAKPRHRPSERAGRKRSPRPRPRPRRGRRRTRGRPRATDTTGATGGGSARAADCLRL